MAAYERRRKRLKARLVKQRKCLSENIKSRYSSCSALWRIARSSHSKTAPRASKRRRIKKLMRIFSSGTAQHQSVNIIFAPLLASLSCMNSMGGRGLGINITGANGVSGMAG